VPAGSAPRRGFLAHTSRAVYGTIVATAVLASTAATLETWGAWHFLITLIATVLVLWFAEIYSDVLGDPSPDPLRARILRAADEHWAVLESAIPLGIPLLLGGLGVMGEESAVWITLIVAVVALAIWGGLSVRQRGGSPLRIAGASLASALIGVLIIILKSLH
jgi:hypothetical protein